MKRHQSTKPDRPVAIGFTAKDAVVILANGDVLTTPLHLHPWLASATSEQRANHEFDPSAIYWPDLDDGLDIEWMRQEMKREAATGDKRTA